MIIEAWDRIHSSEQMYYIEWVSFLVEMDRVPNMNDEEVLEMAIRMHRCDVHHGEFWEL
jgi:hypothetical protein